MGFDKDKPYGLVSGMVAGQPGARYCQNDRYYNPAGQLISDDQKPTAAELGALHWKQLAKLVRERGGVYEDRDSAVRFLTEG